MAAETENQKRAQLLCADAFMLLVGSAPMYRRAGRDDVADALGACAIKLTEDVAAALEEVHEGYKPLLEKLIAYEAGDNQISDRWKAELQRLHRISVSAESRATLAYFAVRMGVKLDA